jgi:hypothetical protein
VSAKSAGDIELGDERDVSETVVSRRTSSLPPGGLDGSVLAVLHAVVLGRFLAEHQPVLAGKLSVGPM